MSDRSPSPKRKASQVIGSPTKRAALAVNSGMEQRGFDNPIGETVINIDEACERTIKNVALRLYPAWPSIDRCSAEAESCSSDSNDTATTIDNDGPLTLDNRQGGLPTPPDSDETGTNNERSISPVIRKGFKSDQRDSESPISDIAVEDDMEDDTEEFGWLLASKEYIKLRFSVTVTRSNSWARVIDVSCTHSNVEVASASGHLIDREFIRDAFYPRMDSLGKPASDRIDELLDHHGYFRWPIKEHYLSLNAPKWNDALDTGSILQIDEVLVDSEWQSQAMGSLLVTSLVERAVKRDCSARFACVLPSTGCFWKVSQKEKGRDAFDASQGCTEQIYVGLFLGVGFARVAETGWFVLDIVDEDLDPGVRLEVGESMASMHTVLITGATK